MALPGKQLIGFFPGNWDLLHPGHVVALKEAREYCDILIVGVKENNADKPDKNEPIQSTHERVTMLEALRAVNLVLTYKSEKELREIDTSGLFHLRFMGRDHKGKKHHKIKGLVVYIKGDQRYHTSKLREKIWKTEQKLRS